MFANRKLLTHYMHNDEDVTIIVNDLKLPVKQSIINCFIPVMKTSLETKLRQLPSKQKTVHITDFDENVVQAFFQFFDEDEWPYYQWSLIVKLIRFSHFYQATDLLKECYNYGQSEITSKNFHEAIGLMALYEFNDWQGEICSVISANPSLMDDEIWQELLKDYPKTMAHLLDRYIKIQDESIKINCKYESLYEMVDHTLSFKSTLLKYYLDNDEMAMVIGDEFELPVQISVINCFIPVVPVLEDSIICRNGSKAGNDNRLTNDQTTDQRTCSTGEGTVQNVLSTGLSMYIDHSDLYTDQSKGKKSKQRTFVVNGFDKATVSSFFKVLKSSDWPRGEAWKEIVKYIKISHYFQAHDLLVECYERGKSKITNSNFHEAIALMNECDFDNWYDKICCIIADNRALTNDVTWTDLLDKHPRTMAYLLDTYIRTKCTVLEKETDFSPIGFLDKVVKSKK